MRRILFCNIAWMEKYKGVTDDDIPVNGGSYVDTTKDAHEAYNFDSVRFDEEEEVNYCLGFFETKSTNGSCKNQLHIEKIDNNLCCQEFQRKMVHHMALDKLMFGLQMKKIMRLRIDI